MGQRLQKLKDVKSKGIKLEEQRALDEAHMKEPNTGLLLRSGSRKLTNDELECAVNKREFVPLEKIDTPKYQSRLAGKGHFTVGVLVDKIGV